MQDISLRALEVLQNVDYILCEDTRRAAKLKLHYQLKPRLISFHEHNEKQRIPQIIERLKRGKSFALISDAGMPLVSDPGYLLVQELIQNEIAFTCVPGASAVTAALVLSGLPVHSFAFHGFLPQRPSARRETLERMARDPGQTQVLFESPERIVGLLREIAETLGDRKAAVCREITKLHEEVLRGSVLELASRLSQRQIKGEFTVVIGPGEEPRATLTDEMIIARYRQLESEGISRKDILKRLAKESGRSRNDLYDLLFK